MRLANPKPAAAACVGDPRVDQVRGRVEACLLGQAEPGAGVAVLAVEDVHISSAIAIWADDGFVRSETMLALTVTNVNGQHTDICAALF